MRALMRAFIRAFMGAFMGAFMRTRNAARTKACAPGGDRFPRSAGNVGIEEGKLRHAHVESSAIMIEKTQNPPHTAGRRAEADSPRNG